LRERLARRTRLLRDRSVAAGPVGPQVEFLGFTKGHERYGVLLEDVVEVQALDQFNAVPGAPAFVRGVVHFRGAILSLLDLGRLFGVAESGLADLHVYIVIEAADKRTAVVASLVEDIFTVARDQLKDAPALPGKVSPEWIAGVHDENRMVVRIDQLLNDPQLIEWSNHETHHR
jgi:purine-binding chemotaxis protein CheW